MLLLAASLVAFSVGEPALQSWLEQAYYPSLLLVFIIASLGVPIPEDMPLIAAGVLLNTHPDIATSWAGTLGVALVGIMSGDMILYSLGRRWGDDVFSHRSVRWLITPPRLETMRARFHRHGTWMVFFGRFVVGVRAVMCLTAGVTRFRFLRFFVADLAGAMVTIPFFVGLGYIFADMLPKLKTVLGGVQWILFVGIALAVGGFIWWEWRRHQRRKLREPAGLSAPPARSSEERVTPQQPKQASRLRRSVPPSETLV